MEGVELIADVSDLQALLAKMGEHPINWAGSRNSREDL